jgi:2-phosphosulfolactate phosphatase
VKIEVAFTPGEVPAGGAAGRSVVVIDVLRATSTILVALCNGARDVVPFETVEQAVRKADEIGREQALLCGERGGRLIPGFDLGNSPSEFVAEKVAGRTLVMTTTNGTRALIVGSAGRRCLAASLLNAAAVAGTVGGHDDDVLLICSGREGRFAVEDAVCAGLIARRLADEAGATPNGDAARVAMLLARRYAHRLPRLLAGAAAGRALRSIGRASDVTWCARADVMEAVPRMRDCRVILQESDRS